MNEYENEDIEIKILSIFINEINTYTIFYNKMRNQYYITNIDFFFYNDYIVNIINNLVHKNHKVDKVHKVHKVHKVNKVHINEINEECEEEFFSLTLDYIKDNYIDYELFIKSENLILIS